MQVKDVMTSRVECVKPEATVQQAARKMRDLDVGSLPVCGENDRLVGIVTDRDIAIRSVAEGQDPTETKVSEAMTPNVLYCFEDQDVEEATQLMKKNQIRRIVALDRDKRLVGIVAIADLATDTGDDALVGEAMEAISEPARQKR